VGESPWRFKSSHPHLAPDSGFSPRSPGACGPIQKDPRHLSPRLIRGRERRELALRPVNDCVESLDRLDRSAGAEKSPRGQIERGRVLVRFVAVTVPWIAFGGDAPWRHSPPPIRDTTSAQVAGALFCALPLASAGSAEGGRGSTPRPYDQRGCSHRGYQLRDADGGRTPSKPLSPRERANRGTFGPTAPALPGVEIGSHWMGKDDTRATLRLQAPRRRLWAVAALFLLMIAAGIVYALVGG
jgi:hypothetical protein